VCGRKTVLDSEVFLRSDVRGRGTRLGDNVVMPTRDGKDRDEGNDSQTFW
jgi:hypothetical protein